MWNFSFKLKNILHHVFIMMDCLLLLSSVSVSVLSLSLLLTFKMAVSQGTHLSFSEEIALR